MVKNKGVWDANQLFTNIPALVELNLTIEAVRAIIDSRIKFVKKQELSSETSKKKEEKIKEINFLEDLKTEKELLALSNDRSLNLFFEPRKLKEQELINDKTKKIVREIFPTGLNSDHQAQLAKIHRDYLAKKTIAMFILNC